MFDEIEAVIFDLDGTLIDSMWMWEAIDIEYLGRFGFDLPKDLQEEIEGISFSETALYFKERFGIQDSPEEMKAEWNRMAWEKYEKEVPLKKGALEFLQLLKKCGIKTGIATSNSIELVELVLGSLHVKKYFDSVHTSCEVERGKPFPDIYEFVAKDLDVKAENCLVFEDIAQGIMAGKNAGMRVCAVYDKFSSDCEDKKRELAEYYITDFTEVIERCKERIAE